jgi:predicted nucleic acid-binding protein
MWPSVSGSVYDAMIVAAAAIASCNVLWTEDLQHGAILEGAYVSNPFLPPQR